jgi:hypothetical protein
VFDKINCVISIKNKNKDMKTKQTKQIVTLEVKQKGRPVNPNSPRQLRLQEQELKKQSGIVLQRGRPVNESSNRQIKLQHINDLKSQGIEIKRGRPVDETSKRQDMLSKRGKVQLGRPVNVNSVRQQVLLQRELRKQMNMEGVGVSE